MIFLPAFGSTRRGRLVYEIGARTVGTRRLGPPAVVPGRLPLRLGRLVPSVPAGNALVLARSFPAGRRGPRCRVLWGGVPDPGGLTWSGPGRLAALVARRLVPTVISRCFLKQKTQY